MVAILERLAKEGKSFPDAHYNPVVNIKFEGGHEESESSPNNIAIYFTGKNENRYYVHIDDDGKLIPYQQKLPVTPNDWKNHLQFTNCYHTPDASSLKSSPGERSSGPHSSREGEFACDAVVPKPPGIRKHGLSGSNLASATNVHVLSKEIHKQQDLEGQKETGFSPTHAVTSTCRETLTGAVNGHN